MDFPITLVCNVSLVNTPTGIGAYNTSNLAIFTTDTFNAGTFGSAGYKIYYEPTSVGTDFGTTSTTYYQANAIFSQQPNILAGNGYLVVIPQLTSVSAVIAQQTLTFSTIPTVGTYQLGYAGNYTTALAYGASNSVVQTALQLVAGLGSATVTGNTTIGFTVTFTGVSGPASLMTIQHDTLQDTNGYDVFITPLTTVIGVAAGSNETLDAAITRTVGLVQYFGVISNAIQSQVVMLAAAAVIQALNKIAFFVSVTAADVVGGGMLDLLRSGSFTQSRGLMYIGTTANALTYMAAYASCALSVNFSGSNTTSTMNLKTLLGVAVDPGMTTVILNNCASAGADTYVSIMGSPSVLCVGANGFFDAIYNAQWFAGALQVEGFNYLKQTNTKIPQTEISMDGYKMALRTVCNQAVTNQYLAPGSWTSSTTFGNQVDFLSNISSWGFYIYSSPISKQLASDRTARKAPVVQIAAKASGAIHSSSIIVNINS